MRSGDARDRGHVGARDRSEPVDLARAVRADLADDHLRRAVRVEDRERDADVVVEALGGAHDAALALEHVEEHLLGRRLARAPRDGDDLGADLVAVEGREAAERRARVGDAEEGTGPGVVGSARRHDGARALGEGLVDERGAVVLGAREGEEDVARAERAGVARDPVDEDALRSVGSVDAERAGDARERDCFHGTLRRDPDRSLFGVPITFLERGIVLLVGAIVRSSHPELGEGA